jgi:hypothetical protein
MEEAPAPYLEDEGEQEEQDEGKTYTEADIAALKAKNFELIGKNKKLAERVTTFEADLAIAREKRNKRLGDEGHGNNDRADRDATALNAARLLERDRLLAAEKGRADTAERKLYDLLVVHEVDSAISAIAPDAIDVLRPHIAKECKVFLEDGEPVARVIDAKGNVRAADSAGNPMTIVQLAETFRTNEKFASVFPAKGSSGSGSRGSGNGAGGNLRAVVITAEQGRDSAFYRYKKAEAERLGVPFVVAD